MNQTLSNLKYTAELLMEANKEVFYTLIQTDFEDNKLFQLQRLIYEGRKATESLIERLENG